MEDTICAISTAIGVSAISIIRLSGNDSIKIANKIFTKDLEKVISHTIHYGKIKYQNEIIDEVMVTVMKSPKTFTKEDIVEINCHGSIQTTNKILEILLIEGARLAEPGEFTKRAFMNGRIDLIEAESIMDLINSKTEVQRKMSLNGIEGKLSNLIRDILDKLLNINANIEVNIDYPEYQDIEKINIKNIKQISNFINDNLKKLLLEAEDGKIIKEGIKTLILGKPNVGKSSILNRLINEEKAIVTDIEGTTRDVVEGQVKINGFTLNLIDTAGIRNTNNKIEKLGVEKSFKLIEEADLILLVLNNNKKLDAEDKKLLEKTKNKKRIIVINKIDLNKNLEIEQLKNEDIVKISVLNDIGIDDLKNKISNLFNLCEINNRDFTYLSNSRQISLVKKAIEKANSLEKAISLEIPIDMLEIDIKEICEILYEIIGESYDEKLLDKIFSNFCVGK